MELTIYVVVCLAAILISSLVSSFLPRVATPLIQIALGIAIAVTPLVVDVQIDSDLFMLIFVAPLLFNDGRNSHKKSLWKNRWSILSLALGLVVLTVVAGGFFVNWMIPAIPLTAAFALMAALAPTDAVAVTALSGQIEVSNRQHTLLEGEALLNDASGLVAFQAAVAAALYGTFSVVEAAGSFVLVFCGGLLVGCLLMIGRFYLVKWLRSIDFDDTAFYVLLEVCTPFLVYMIAEALGVSGILAVVAAGLMHSYGSEKVNPAYARREIVSTSTWSVLVRVLEGFVFIFLGSQLPRTIANTWAAMPSIEGSMVLWALALTAFIMGVRFAWVYLVNSPARIAGQPRRARLSDKVRSASVITLCGPKGAVAIAVILSLPYALPGGEAFPQRDLLLFLASMVVILTLLATNFIAPLVSPREEETVVDVDALLEILRMVIVKLSGLVDEENADAVREVTDDYNKRIERLKRTHDVDDTSARMLRCRIAEWERENTIRRMDAEVTPAYVGYGSLLRISRKLEGSERGATFRYMRGVLKLRRLHRAERVRLNNRAAEMGVPGYQQRHEARRALWASNYAYVLGRLERSLSEVDPLSAESTEQVEDISAAIVFYQRKAQYMANRGIGGQLSTVAGRLTVDEARDEVETQALQFEREEIGRLYREGRISTATARRMRNNVAMMDLDVDIVTD